MLTTFNEVRMSGRMEMRNAYKVRDVLCDCYLFSAIHWPLP